MVPLESRTFAGMAAVRSTGGSQWHLGVLGSLLLALIGGATASLLIERISPAFTVPVEFHLPDLGPPPEKVAALQAQQEIADRRNAMLELACFGALVAGAVTFGESLARRHPIPLLTAVPLSALAGCLAGLVGSLVYGALDVRTVASVTETVKFQVVLLSVLGIGLGTAIGMTTGKLRTAMIGGLSGLAGGVLMGFLYPVVVSFAMPSANIAAIIPQGLVNRLIWCEFAAASYVGLVIPGLKSDLPRYG